VCRAFLRSTRHTQAGRIRRLGRKYSEANDARFASGSQSNALSQWRTARRPPVSLEVINPDSRKWSARVEQMARYIAPIVTADVKPIRTPGALHRANGEHLMTVYAPECGTGNYMSWVGLAE